MAVAVIVEPQTLNYNPLLGTLSDGVLEDMSLTSRTDFTVLGLVVCPWPCPRATGPWPCGLSLALSSGNWSLALPLCSKVNKISNDTGQM